MLREYGRNMQKRFAHLMDQNERGMDKNRVRRHRAAFFAEITPDFLCRYFHQILLPSPFLSIPIGFL